MFVWQYLPPEDLSFLPRYHTVCDCTATLLRGATWEKHKDLKNCRILWVEMRWPRDKKAEKQQQGKDCLLINGQNSSAWSNHWLLFNRMHSANTPPVYLHPYLASSNISKIVLLSLPR